jgi:hypothetical protein
MASLATPAGYTSWDDSFISFEYNVVGGQKAYHKNFDKKIIVEAGEKYLADSVNA